MAPRDSSRDNSLGGYGHVPEAGRVVSDREAFRANVGGTVIPVVFWRSRPILGFPRPQSAVELNRAEREIEQK